MALVQFKFKKADASTQLATFDKQPSWWDLVTEINNIFAILSDDVMVSYIDEDKDTITLHNEEELQRFYKSLGPSPGRIKFVVQDIKVPDTSISSTWSKDSDLFDISKSDDELDLSCLVLNGSNTPFTVKIIKSWTVHYLKKAIKKEKEPGLNHLVIDSIILWKLSSPIPSDEINTKLEHVQHPQEIPGCIKLDPLKPLFEYFPSPRSKHLHIIVELPPSTSRKRKLSPIEEDSHVTKKERIAELPTQKKWTVNGAIRETDIIGCYYLDPGTQHASKLCLQAVLACELSLLWGARASGKTTRMLWLQKELITKGYRALYISFDRIKCKDTIEVFWKSFSSAIAAAAAATSHLELPTDSCPWVSSQEDFLTLFQANSWHQKVVLLIDELDTLYNAPQDIRDECLQTFREIRNNNQIYAICSIIAAGTFGILKLNTLDSKISPFNIADHVKNPYFKIEDVKRLYHEFAADNMITIDDAVVDDIWAKSNGHPAMVCLCGRIIVKNLEPLLDINRKAISYQNWQQFPQYELYNEISAYNTFNSMINSLIQPEAAEVVNLLRTSFVGFLDEVELNNSVELTLADFLTSEGVLLKPDSVRPNYCMASPLIDGLIRNKLIPLKFPNSPSSAPPVQKEGNLHVLNILVESVKFFNKALIRHAASRSYKTTKANVPSAPDGHVPRESVYDTELMRILSNWLQNRYNWTVTGQWHLQTDKKKHKYTDIVIKGKDHKTIVLELLATGDKKFVQSHIQKTPEYMALLSATEGWVVHFTCEQNYVPIWQSDEELLSGVNVVHFLHDLDFTNLEMSVRWKDCSGKVWKETSRVRA